MLIHGSVLHKSDHNRSDKSRWIYTFHMIEGDAEYPKDNWFVVLGWDFLVCLYGH